MRRPARRAPLPRRGEALMALRALVDRYLATINARDFDSWSALHAEDVEVLADTGPMRGRAAARQFAESAMHRLARRAGARVEAAAPRRTSALPRPARARGHRRVEGIATIAERAAGRAFARRRRRGGGWHETVRDEWPLRPRVKEPSMSSPFIFIATNCLKPGRL